MSAQKLQISNLPAFRTAMSLLLTAQFSLVPALAHSPYSAANNVGSVSGVCGILIASADIDKAADKSSDKSSDKIEKSNEKNDENKVEKSAKTDKSTAKSKVATSKSEKTEKSEKSEKNRNDKKNKSEKVAADDSDKNRDRKKKKESKHGLFGNKRSVEEEPVAKEEPKKEEENKIVFQPDAALISVLKDLSRSLKESEPFTKIDNPSARTVVTLAQEILDKALSDSKLDANRILAKDQAEHSKAHLTAESWSSGDVAITEKFHGSLATVWAKRIDGLLTVTVAGDCQDRKTDDGNNIGEFIVIFTARSPVESGFDIQSQGNVNFWIGKLGDITVEADCIRQPGTEKAESDLKKKRLKALSPLLTNRYRLHYQLLARASQEQEQERRQIALKLALQNTAEKTENKENGKEEPAKVSSASAPENSESTDKGEIAGQKNEKTSAAEAATQKTTEQSANSDKTAKIETARETAEKVAAGAGEKIAGNTGEKTVDKTAAPINSQKEATASPAKSSQIGLLPNNSAPNNLPQNNLPQNNLPQNNLPQAYGQAKEQIDVENRAPERETELPALRQPKNFILLAPERVLAGQPLTVGFLDEQRNPESNVALSFNGVSLTTDQNGQAQYSVPEDETPGRSLNISLPSRPYEMPSVIEVLQPLTTPSQPQAPRLDRSTPLLSKNSTLTIDGHNFDGIAPNNRVIIDGVYEAQIVAASPVQLKVLLPKELTAGLHTICVSTQGMRSNPMGFELAMLEVRCEGKDNKENKDNANKLVVRVLGTTSKVGVKVINRSPEFIKLNRGEEKLTSSGGHENSLTLPLQRIKKGPVKVEAWLEL